MKLRTTLVLLLLGVGAWLAIRFMGEPPRRDLSLAPLVPREMFEKWDEIECHLFSRERVKFVRLPGGSVELRFGSDKAGNLIWQYHDLASPLKLEQLLAALQQSSREPFEGATSENDLLRLGLAEPRYRVTVRSQGRVVDIGFGEEDPSHQGILARSYGDGQVFGTARKVPNVLDSNLDEFRDRALFPFEELAVTELTVVRYHEGAESAAAPEIVVVARDDRDSSVWRVREPAPLLADAQRCRSFVHQACALTIDRFAGQAWNEELLKITGLPDHPVASITLMAGPTVVELEIGGKIGDSLAARMKQRDENLCFTIKRTDLERLIALQPDDLRARRLFPAVEKSLVALTCKSAGGEVRWAAERQAQVVRGAWEITAPFTERAHEGLGRGSFPQLVADLDRLEVLDFRDASAPLPPEASLELKWRNGPIVESRTLEIAGEGDHVRARVLGQPGELFHMPAKLAEIVAADVQLFRDRTIFPRHDEFAPRLVHWKLEWPPDHLLELKRASLGAPSAVVAGRPEQQPTFESAAAELFGAQADGFVRAATVQKSGLDRPTLALTLGTIDGEQRLTVGAEGEGAFYCSLSPRLPDDVLILVPRGKLQPLLDLAR